MIYCPHKGKREATERWFVMTGECHLALEQVDLKGTRMTILKNNWSRVFKWQFHIRMTIEQTRVTAKLKNFDIKNGQSKTAQKNLYDPVKTSSISRIYLYNHLPNLPAYLEFVFHPSLNINSLSLTPPLELIDYIPPLPEYW